jgi:isocitrate dehydrogenase
MSEENSERFVRDQIRYATEELKTVVKLLKKLGVNAVEIEAVVDDVLYLKGE